MGTLHVLEYEDIGSTTRGSVPIPLEPAKAEQDIDIGADNAVSAAFGPQTAIVTLQSDVDCAIAVGPSPDASNSARILRAGKPQTVTVRAGSNMRVAVIAHANATPFGLDGALAILAAATDPKGAQDRLASISKQVDALNAAGAAHKAASDAAKKDRADADAMMAKVEAAVELHSAAAAELQSRNDALVASVANHQAAVDAAEAAFAQRTKSLDQREADLVTRSDALNKVEADLSVRAKAVDTRDADLKAREATVAAAEADYADRVAKLKALAG